MTDTETIVRGFSLTPVEMEIIERVSYERALLNLSAALRQIIREWAVLAEKTSLKQDAKINAPLEQQ